MASRFADLKSLEIFLSISLVTLISVLLIANSFLGVVLAIKGAYVFIGVSIATGLYFLPKIADLGIPNQAVGNEKVISKLIFILISLSVITTVVLGTRTPLLLIFFPVAYGLFGVQLYLSPSSRVRLAEALSLFSVSLVTKYYDYYRLIGNGDIILHIRSVHSVISTGSFIGIGRGYSKFPILHVLSGNTGIVADLGPYDSLMVVGISTYVLLILVMFLYARLISTFTIAIYTAVSATVLVPFHFFSTYVFPQSLAVGYGIYLIYISYKTNTTSNKRPFVTIGVILSSLLVFTHHFTIVLILPAILVLSLFYYIEPPITDSIKTKSLANPSKILLSICIVMATAYWVFIEAFIGAFYFSIKNKIEQQLLIDSSTGNVGIISIGRVVDPQTPVEAVLSLLSPSGIYYIFIVCVFYLGICQIFTPTESQEYPWPELLLGVSGSMFILKTPVITNARLGHIFAVFFAICLAFGLKWIFETSNNKLSLFVASILVISTLGTTAPLAANSDLYGFNSAPDLYGEFDKPSRERSLTSMEYRTLAAGSSFSKEFSAPVTTDWTSSLVMHRFEGRLSVPINQFAIKDVAKYREGKLYSESNIILYRLSWADHTITFAGGRFVISKGKIESMATVNSKVYTTGQTGMLWSDSAIIIDQNETK